MVDRNRWPYTKAVPSDNKHINYKHLDLEHTTIRAGQNSLENLYIPLQDRLQMKWLIALFRLI